MFNTRYQMGVLITMFFLWMVLIQKTPVRQLILFCLVVVATIAVGVGVDSIGYGQFELAPWNYLKVNLMEGRAATFGSSPWYYYILALLIVPMGPVLLVVTLLFWVKYPKNVFTWMTFAFVVIHMALSHKEIRFLIPVLPLIVAALIFVIPEKWFIDSSSGNPFVERGRWIKWAFYLFVMTNVGMLVVATVRPPIPFITVHQYIRSVEPDHFEFYSLGSSPYFLHQTVPPRFEFYAPEKITHHVLGSLSELRAVLAETSPVYFYYHDQILPDAPAWNLIRERCKVAYLSFPAVLNDWNYRKWMTRAQSSSIYKCR